MWRDAGMARCEESSLDTVWEIHLIISVWDEIGVKVALPDVPDVGPFS
jgi:hypothetical protein